MPKRKREQLPTQREGDQKSLGAFFKPVTPPSQEPRRAKTSRKSLSWTNPSWEKVAMGRTLIEAVEEVGEVFIHTERLKKKVVSISRQHVDRYIIYLLSFMLSSLVGVSRMLHNEQRGQFPSRQPPHTKQFHRIYCCPPPPPSPPTLRRREEGEKDEEE